jgi:hypothetical protein
MRVFHRALVLMMAMAFGCGGGVDPGPGRDAQPGSALDAAPIRDGGSDADDGGMPVPGDGAAPTPDGGTDSDSGTLPAVDAGTEPDGGAQPADAGIEPDATQPVDAGIPDAGIDAAPGDRCNPTRPECDNCIDDDGDGLVDGFDPHCTLALDNDESSFATGIPGDNRDTSILDCFYDGNSGSGDDGCAVPSCCLLGTCAPGTQCDPTAQCTDFCAPAVPTGCDCFGCCTVCNDAECRDVLVYPALAPSCDLDSLADPGACPVCQKVESCARTCEISATDCILCAGQTDADLPLTCNGQHQCPGGETVCATSADCTASQYCSHGCCVAMLVP